MNEQQSLKCLIVDDEPPARQILSRYISEMPRLHLAGECSNAVQALNFLQHEHIDILFLDILMPQLKGTDLLKIIKPPSKVIFTTAHAEYALEGYELDVVDYLLKPIRFERFVKAVHKAMQLPMTAEAPSATLPGQDSFIYFRAERKMVKVMLSDILYVESMKDYVKLFTSSGVIVTKQSISSVEAMLPDHLFIRTHRSFIVSLGKINSFTAEIIEIGKMEIPIGKLYRNTVLKVLG